MKINLKTTILISSLVAVTLNVWQYFSSYQQKKEASSPGWAFAKEAPATTPGPAVNKLTSAQTAPAAQTTAAKPAAPTSADAVAAKLTAAGLNPTWAGLYLSASQQTGVPWQLLAAVHRVETGQSGSTNRASYAGATGPMQFMPATWSHYAADGNGDGTKDINNVDDAVLGAGRYLASNGAANGQYSNALYHYNHSWSYVSNVTGIARTLGL